MLIKANGAIKTVINKSLKKKKKFWNRNNEQNKFFSNARNYY